MKIRIIGARKCSCPGSADFKQTSASICGISQQVDLHEAELIVFWPGPSLLTHPTSKEMAELGPGLPVSIAKQLTQTLTAIEAEKEAGFQSAIDTDFVGEYEVAPGAKTKLSGFRIWTSGNEIEARNILQGAVEHTLSQCMLAVHAGAVFVLVIPENYLSWPVGGNIAQWIIPGLQLDAMSDVWVDQFSAPPSPPGSLWAWISSAHIKLRTKPWPFDMAIKVARRYRKKGEYQASDIFPEIDSDERISFYPGAFSTRKKAKSLLLEYGKGGIIVMPPFPLKELIRVANRDYSKIKAQPSLSLAFKGKSTIGRGSKLPKWIVLCNGTDVKIGHKTFLILLACVVAAKLGQDGIYVTSPKIKNVKLGSNILVPAEAPDKRRQQVNDVFSAANIKFPVLDTGHSKGNPARHLMLSSILPPDSISLDPLKKSSDTDVQSLLDIYNKYA